MCTITGLQTWAKCCTRAPQGLLNFICRCIKSRFSAIRRCVVKSVWLISATRSDSYAGSCVCSPAFIFSLYLIRLQFISLRMFAALIWSRVFIWGVHLIFSLAAFGRVYLPGCPKRGPSSRKSEGTRASKQAVETNFPSDSSLLDVRQMYTNRFLERHNDFCPEICQRPASHARKQTSDPRLTAPWSVSPVLHVRKG